MLVHKPNVLFALKYIWTALNMHIKVNNQYLKVCDTILFRSEFRLFLQDHVWQIEWHPKLFLVLWSKTKDNFLMEIEAWNKTVFVYNVYRILFLGATEGVRVLSGPSDRFQRGCGKGGLYMDGPVGTPIRRKYLPPPEMVDYAPEDAPPSQQGTLLVIQL